MKELSMHDFTWLSRLPEQDGYATPALFGIIWGPELYKKTEAGDIVLIDKVELKQLLLQRVEMAYVELTDKIRGYFYEGLLPGESGPKYKKYIVFHSEQYYPGLEDIVGSYNTLEEAEQAKEKDYIVDRDTWEKVIDYLT